MRAKVRAKNVEAANGNYSRAFFEGFQIFLSLLLSLSLSLSLSLRFLFYYSIFIRDALKRVI